jgi:hypothetical protein
VALLSALAAPETPRALHDLPAVQLLRRVWEQQFAISADQVLLREPQALPQRPS